MNQDTAGSLYEQLLLTSSQLETALKRGEELVATNHALSNSNHEYFTQIQKLEALKAEQCDIILKQRDELMRLNKGSQVKILKSRDWEPVTQS